MKRYFCSGPMMVLAIGVFAEKPAEVDYSVLKGKTVGSRSATIIFGASPRPRAWKMLPPSMVLT